MIRNIRILGAALGGIVGLALATSLGGVFDRGGLYYGFYLAAWVIAWMVVGFAILPYLTIVPAERLVRSVQALSTAEFVTAVLGLLIGLLMGLLLGIPLSNLPDPLGTGSRWQPRSGSGSDGRADRRQAPGSGRRRRRRSGCSGAPSPRTGRPTRDPHIVVDTSAIIDGRIAEIAESGFIYGTLVVPRFVLDELQHIADSADTLRRNRGRRGLEILARMQKDPPTPVEIVADDFPDIGEVDASSSRWPSARAARS